MSLCGAVADYRKEGNLQLRRVAFEHERFIEVIADIEGQAIVSYTTPPDALADLGWWVVDQEYRKSAAAGKQDWGDTSTERLFLNFDPD